jgi:Mannosyltransferase (PIG-V)
VIDAVVGGSGEPGAAAERGARSGGWSGIGHEVVAVLPAWITARVLVLAGYVLAVAVSNRLVGQHPEQLNNGLLAWDGTFYRDLATSGYRSLPVGALRFFPLFPLLGRLVAAPLGGHVGVVLVVLANGLSLAVLVLVRRLVVLEKDDLALADRAVWCMAIFPAAFVLVFAYSESLMLVVTLALFLCLRRGRWWWVAPLGLAAALSRPLGVVVAVPVMVEAVRGWRTLTPGDWAARAAGVVAPFVGLATYLAWVGHAFGNWRLPFTVQDDLRGGVRFPVSRIIEGFHQLAGSQRFGDGLHLPFLLGLLVLLVVVFRTWPLLYGLYASAILVLALSAENLNSIERYGMSAFPLLLALAVVMRPPQVDRAVMAVMGGGVVALSSMAWLGAYVP